MPNPVVWFEVQGKEPDKLQKFYSDTFGWQINMDNPIHYGMIEAQEGKGIGGGIGKGVAPWATFYIEVEDVEATLKVIEANGGSVIVPCTTIPDMVTFGVFADLEGNKVGLVKSEQP